MIWDSTIWKEELQNEMNQFDSYITSISDSDYDSDIFTLEFEKFYFVCSYIIRKLIDSKKLNVGLENKGYSCIKYTRTNNNPLDFLNSHHFSKFYDLSNGIDIQLSMTQLCNRFIHSFILFPAVNGNNGSNFTGVFVNTDYDKKKCLYQISYKTFVLVLNDVINDNVVSLHYIRENPK